MQWKTALKVIALTTFAFAEISGRGATISNFVETPETLSFDFTGHGESDFWQNSLPTLTYWQFSSGLRLSGSQWADIFAVEHLTGGTKVVFNGFAQVGNPLLQILNAPHFEGVDEYNFDMVVNVIELAPGIILSGWGDFTGSFRAVHTSAAVPDAESSLNYLLCGAGMLALFRRRIFANEPV